MAGSLAFMAAIFFVYICGQLPGRFAVLCHYVAVETSGQGCRAEADFFGEEVDYFAQDEAGAATEEIIEPPGRYIEEICARAARLGLGPWSPALRLGPRVSPHGFCSLSPAGLHSGCLELGEPAWASVPGLRPSVSARGLARMGFVLSARRVYPRAGFGAWHLKLGTWHLVPGT
jgi:hypothetical protein